MQQKPDLIVKKQRFRFSEEMFRVVVGNNIRQRRARLRVSQTQLARMTGMSTSYISQIENGNYSISAFKLAIIAQALDTPVNWFMEKDDFPH